MIGVATDDIDVRCDAAGQYEHLSAHHLLTNVLIMLVLESCVASAETVSSEYCGKLDHLSHPSMHAYQPTEVLVLDELLQLRAISGPHKVFRQKRLKLLVDNSVAFALHALQ